MRSLVFLRPLTALACWLGSPGVLLAQEEAAASTFRGPGFYFSLPKLISVWLLYMLWTATADWVSRDCVKRRLGYSLWNPIVVFTFVGALVLFWLLPSFAISFPILALAYLAPTITYVVVRNRKAEMHEKVLTPLHFKFLLAAFLRNFGVKMDVGYVDPHEKGNKVKITAQGGATERDNNVNLLTSRQSPGFVLVGDTLADAFENRADALLMEFTAESVGIKYQIDGMWHDNEPLDRESGDLMLEVMKRLCNLKPEERVAAQSGYFSTQYENIRRNMRLTAQGTKTGERALVRFDRVDHLFKNLEETGMRPKVREQVRELLNAAQGWVIFAAAPGHGLTTTIDTTLQDLDRFLRNFATVEDVHKPERDVQNVGVTTYDSRQGQSPATVLDRLIRTYPDVLVVRDVVNKETAAILCEQAVSSRMVITGMRANEASEALVNMLALGTPPDKFARSVTCVVYQRLIRKLCEECREAFPPAPELLKKLGIPPGRVESLYQPPAQPERVCPKCNGMGYIGRTALFEVLVVDDKIRQLLLKQPKVELIRQAARQAGMKTLQEEGVLLVAKGITSLQELQRMLKG